MYHRDDSRSRLVSIHKLGQMQLDLVAVDRELFTERQYVRSEPSCEYASRLKGIGALQLLGVIQIVVHNRESLQHHGDGDVVYRKGHIALHRVGSRHAHAIDHARMLLM
jgi:hypothetical protein